jgi:hypothetical protein
MNCVRTSVGKPHDELRGYNGLVDCIWKAAADRIAKLVGQYCGREEGSLAVIQEAKSEIINFGRFTDESNITEAKLGETFGQWLDGKAVYVFQTRQGMIWNGAYWRADERGLMIKFAYNFIREAKQALFDIGNHSAAGNLSSFESLSISTCPPRALPQKLSLDRLEERFDCRIVIASPGPAHRHLEAMLAQDFLVVMGTILAAAVGVMDAALGRLP